MALASPSTGLKSGIRPEMLVPAVASSSAASSRPRLAASELATGAAAEASGSSSAFGTSTEAFSFAAAAICCLSLVRVWRSSRRTHVARRARHHQLHEPTYWRCKAGAKYRYRKLDDHAPEWGVWPQQEDGREVFGQQLIYPGTPGGPKRYQRELAYQQARRDAGKKCALLLDCDGTIVETERDGHRQAFNEAFEEKGYDIEWGVEEYGELIKTAGGKERITRYFEENPEAWDQEDEPSPDHPLIKELHELKTELFMEIVQSGMMPLRKGIKELIDKALEEGWNVGVCSTSNEAAVTEIVKTYLPSVADKIKIFAGDVVKAKKPDPEIYNLAAESFGVAPMSCVVIEDSNIGMQAGKAAGMQVIVTRSFYSADEDFDDADLVVDSAEEIGFEEDILAMVPIDLPEPMLA